jgi:DNA-binding response OmpR family regulator
MPRILIADDDIELCNLLTEYLVTESFDIDCAHDGLTAIDKIAREHYDALILDVMLPKMMGFDVLKQIRKTSDIPVLMLTAKGEDIDRILGLELGADDYLPKPCNPRELVARLRAILRRSNPANKQNKEEELNIAGISLNSANRSVTFQTTTLVLTSAEFNILLVLMRSAGEVVSREDLTLNALGRKLTPYDRSIDVHISKIRKKLHAISANDELISNIRGSGYQLNKHPGVF